MILKLRRWSSLLGVRVGNGDIIMSRTWVISDTHFGHKGVTQFLRKDGSKLRPWDHPDEMDEALVANWNSVVEPRDRVYHLGDVAINRRALPILNRLNGRKVLVKGNHDIFKLSDYVKYFDDIRAYVVGKFGPDKMYVMSHVPVHESQLYRFNINIHGHLHSDTLDDPRYINVSVEQINYTPIELTELCKRVFATD